MTTEIQKALETLKNALQKDEEFAWGYHCNFACASIDEGMDHIPANRAASRIMRSLFDIDMEKHRHYKDIVSPKKATTIFFDTEFTGLHQNTTLISIGLVAGTGETFYAEFDDYNSAQVDEWISKNVISNLSFTQEHYRQIPNDINPVASGYSLEMRGNTANIVRELKTWFRQFGKITIWSDCLAYDWVLFCNLFGNALSLPGNIYYIPFDICTLFKIVGVDPDVSREDYAEVTQERKKHNALWDAQVIRACHIRLMREYSEGCYAAKLTKFYEQAVELIEEGE